MNLFVTGIDTDAGKTYVSTLILRALRRAGFGTVPMKPFCCGGREDAEKLRAACDNALSLDEINPVSYTSPTSPYAAAKLENRPADVAAVMDHFRRLRAAYPSVLVEGVGGWMVPITRTYYAADLAAEMDLPIVLVVRNRLGALNHAILTVRDIERRGLKFAGIVFNRVEPEADPAAATNRELLEELLGTPVLCEVAPGQGELDASGLQARLSELE